jgi:hypothetical protein
MRKRLRVVVDSCNATSGAINDPIAIHCCLVPRPHLAALRSTSPTGFTPRMSAAGPFRLSHPARTGLFIDSGVIVWASAPSTVHRSRPANNLTFSSTSKVHEPRDLLFQGLVHNRRRPTISALEGSFATSLPGPKVPVSS